MAWSKALVILIGRSRGWQENKSPQWSMDCSPNKASHRHSIHSLIHIFLPAATARRSLTTKVQCMQRWHHTTMCIYNYIYIYIFINMSYRSIHLKIFWKTTPPFVFHEIPSYMFISDYSNHIKLVWMKHILTTQPWLINKTLTPTCLTSRDSWTSAESWLP